MLGGLKGLIGLGRDDKQVEGEDDPRLDEPIGYDVTINGQRQFHAMSSAEIRAAERKFARREAKDQKRGQRHFNRSQRALRRRRGTADQQLRILQGEIEVSPDMRRNLERHVVAEHQRAQRAETEQDRRDTAVDRREQRASARQALRFLAGKPRGKDFRAADWERNSHLLPGDYAGKVPGDA